MREPTAARACSRSARRRAGDRRRCGLARRPAATRARVARATPSPASTACPSVATTTCARSTPSRSDRREPADATCERHVLDRLIDEELLVQRGLELGPRRGSIRACAATWPRRDRAPPPSPRPHPDEPTAAELRAFYDAHGDYFARGRARARAPDLRGRRARPTPTRAPPTRRGACAPASRSPRSPTALGDRDPAPLPDALLPPAKLRDYLGPTPLRAALDLHARARSAIPVRSTAGLPRPGARRPADADRRRRSPRSRRRCAPSGGGAPASARCARSSTSCAPRATSRSTADAMTGARLGLVLLACAARRAAPAAAHGRSVSYSTWTLDRRTARMSAPPRRRSTRRRSPGRAERRGAPRRYCRARLRAAGRRRPCPPVEPPQPLATAAGARSLSSGASRVRGAGPRSRS